MNNNDLKNKDLLSFEWDLDQKEYNKPPISIFKDKNNTSKGIDDINNFDKNIIEDKINNLGVGCKIVSVKLGPQVTTFIIDLNQDSNVRMLSKILIDLQLFLKCKKMPNLVYEVPGTPYCALEVPNIKKGIVNFKDIISRDEYINKDGKLLCAIGKTTLGEIYTDDIVFMPHALICGMSGSGKTILLNNIIMNLIIKYSPEDVRLMLIDYREFELTPYNNLPHVLFNKSLSNPEEIWNAFRWINFETQRRYKILSENKYHRIDEYNNEQGVEKLPRIVIIIDEASLLIDNIKYGRDLVNCINTLSKIGRIIGIHIILSTQNTIKSIITPEIQNNLITKMVLTVSDERDSLIAMKEKGAENLLGCGDMIVKKGPKKTRVQVSYVDIEDIKNICKYIIENNKWIKNNENINSILTGEFFKNLKD